MFECRLTHGSLLRKIMEAISPLVTEVNIECTSSGEPSRNSFTVATYHHDLYRTVCASNGHCQRVPGQHGTWS